MLKNFSRIGKETISKLGSWTILALRHIGIILQTNQYAGSQRKVSYPDFRRAKLCDVFLLDFTRYKAHFVAEVSPIIGKKMKLSQLPNANG